jgi:hypothetical protein
MDTSKYRIIEKTEGSVTYFLLQEKILKLIHFAWDTFCHESTEREIKLKTRDAAVRFAEGETIKHSEFIQ